MEIILRFYLLPRVAPHVFAELWIAQQKLQAIRQFGHVRWGDKKSVFAVVDQLIEETHQGW